MPDELSLSALARRLGRSKSGLHALSAKGLIPHLPSGKYDLDAVASALARNLDPARSRTNARASERTNSKPKISTEGEAREAVALIARVLQGEGVATGDIDFNAARTAETILKTYERDLKIAERRKELVPLAAVKLHVEKAFIGYRQAIQRLPSRHVPEMAATLGVDPGALDAALSKAIAAELDALSAPIVRG